MNIGFDGRMYGLEHAGIGRYIKNILHQILEQDSKNSYTVFLHPKHIESIKLPDSVKKVPSPFRHYTLKEQTAFLKLLNQHSLDLVHFPHFNVPFFYNKPFVVTIHDILWHTQKGPGVTTLSPLVYALKYQAYKKVVSHAVKNSRHIITPSEYVSGQIIKEFKGIKLDKITPIYEGVDQDIKKSQESIALPEKLKIDEPYFVYTGSAYPHKNIPIIFEALKYLSEDIKLVIVGSRSVFLDSLKKEAKEKAVSDQIIFAGYLEDNVLAAVYDRAEALIQPSKSEGFGLTGLEAMQLDLPVISSTAGSLPEVYGSAAQYFDPNNAKELSETMQRILEDETLKKEMMQKGRDRTKMFSWEKAAKETLGVYKLAQ